MSASSPLPPPPRGWKAVLWRLPVWLYRLRLDFLLGSRFLLLEHLGRKTGRWRQNVLEVIGHDPQGLTYFVASGFGRRSHWFRNIQAHPEVFIRIRGKRLRARAEILGLEPAAEILQDYARRHPLAFRELSRFLKIPVPQDPEDKAGFRRLAEILPVVAFRVQTSTQGGQP